MIYGFKKEKKMTDDTLSRSELLELLSIGKLTNQECDKEGRVIALRIEDMKEEDIKEAVVEFVYSRTI